MSHRQEKSQFYKKKVIFLLFKKMNIWLLIIFLFFEYNIEILFEEKYGLSYSYAEKNMNFDYSACVPLNKMKFSKPLLVQPRIDLEQLRTEVFESVSKFREELRPELMYAIETKQFYLLNYHFCFIFRNSMNTIIQIEEYLYHETDAEVKLFIFQEYRYQFFSDGLASLKIEQHVIRNLEYPYSNCQKYDQITGRLYSKFNCSNNCLNNKMRSLKYFHSSNETGLVHLDELKDDEEEECFQKECRRDDCELFFKIPSFGYTIKVVRVLAANRLMTELEFFIQFMGLVSLFFNFSIFQILVYLVKFWSKKLKKEFYELRVRKNLFKIRIALFVICMIPISIIYCEVIKNYIHQMNNPLEREIFYFNYESQPFSIYFCRVVDFLEKYENYIDGLDGFNMNDDDDTKHSEMTFKEMEEATNDLFNKTFKSIYLTYEGKNQGVRWEYRPKKVLFYYIPLTGTLSRCFHIVVYPKEAKYQDLIRVSRITLEFKKISYVFLEPGQNDLTTKSKPYLSSYSLLQRILERNGGKTPCTNYEINIHNCSNQYNCIGMCITKQIAKLYSAIADDVVIDKDHLSEKQYDGVYFNKISNKTINEECKTKYSIPDCVYTYFEQRSEINGMAVDEELNLVYKIELYYMIIKRKEGQVYLPGKFAMDMLTIQGIFFGLNIWTFIYAIWNLLIKSTKLAHSNKSKRLFFFFFFYCVSAVGYLIHSVFLINTIINGDLIYFQFFETTNVFAMPELIFCFKFNDSFIDPNTKLTGHYLNQNTNNLTVNKIFDKIIYLNKLNEFITIQPNLTGHSNRINGDLKIKTFFFQSKKCFQFKLSIDYEQRSFYFQDDQKVLRLFLNNTIIRQMGTDIYFFSKKRNTMELSKISRLNFKKRIITSLDDNGFEITQELHELILNDKFKLIKNPLILFYGENDIYDVTGYIRKLKNGFYRNYNHMTRELHIKESFFDLEIDDDLFEQYYLQVQNRTDHQIPKNVNFERSSYINYQRPIYSLNNPDLCFIPKFYTVRLIIMNDDNFSKLVVNILNLFAFWFDFIILNFYFYFAKVGSVFIFLYKFLIRTKHTLNRSKRINLLNERVHHIEVTKLETILKFKSNPIKVSKYGKYSNFNLLK